MKLVDLIRDFENIDEDSVIYLQDLGNWNSDIIIRPIDDEEEGDFEMTITEDGKSYQYLIEMYIALDFLEDQWEDDEDASDELLAERLHQYATKEG